MPNTGSNIESYPQSQGAFDYSYVPKPARIAIYDDLLSSPNVITIEPGPTKEFLGNLSSEIYNRSAEIGGKIPFTAIRQVAENFIHAHFEEMVVSILDNGNTIRFTDQGPGIADKDASLRPGFSSATAPMKEFIDGVGSGLPIVREYLDIKHGNLYIEDNLNGGSVITLSLMDSEDNSSNNTTHNGISPSISRSNDPQSNDRLQIPHIDLTPRARNILSLLNEEGTLGVQDISRIVDIPLSSTHTELKKLEEAGFIERIGKKRTISKLGQQVSGSFRS